MDYSKEKNAPWLSVPEFGAWDQKGVMPDYSMDFSKIREMRKQNKRDPSRASLGNEEEFVSTATTDSNAGHSDDRHHFHQNNSPTFFEVADSCRAVLEWIVRCQFSYLSDSHWIFLSFLLDREGEASSDTSTAV